MVIALLFLVAEPPRTSDNDRIPIHGRWLRSPLRRPALLLKIASFGATAVVTYNYAIWLPSVFVREWWWTIGEIGGAYGIIVLCCGAGGMLIAGALGNVVSVHRHGLLTLVTTSTAGVVGGAVALGVVSEPVAALGAAAITMFCLAFPIGLAPAILLAEVAQDERGRVVALGSLAITILGLGAGPTCMAALELHLGTAPQTLRSALVATTAAAAYRSPLPLLASRFTTSRFVQEQ